MEDKLLNTYNDLLNDLQIGYPIDQSKLNTLILLIHKLHFISFSPETKTVLKIMERYG